MNEKEFREEKIAAYASGCMSAEEKAAFEESLEQNVELKRELESYQSLMSALDEWTKAEPPGIHRVDALEAPFAPEQKG